MKQKSIFILTFILIFSAGVYADEITGKPGIFLRIPANAKQLGLGSATAAVNDAVSGLDNNPTAIYFSEKIIMSFTHSTIFSDFTVNNFYYIEPVDDNNSISVSGKLLNSDKIDKTIILNWNEYENLGTYKTQDFLIGFGYARLLKSHPTLFNHVLDIVLGTNIKYYNSKIDRYSTYSVLSDFGINIRDFTTPFTFSFSILNFGKKIKYVNTTESLPTLFKLGISYEKFKNKGLMICSEITRADNKDFYFGSGAQYTFSKNFAARIGYDSSNDADDGLSMGLTCSFHINEKDILLNYSYKPFSDLGNYSFITLDYKY